ncbi:MAG: 1,6-anhydro-N-acetylmuramyl-L-alanine amidase AmpD [Sedimenticola sp.]|uniref:1,6-anhydro-N-acetylmuramyl-L-alanine amidase AmpD n=1 Tax=Sedimenticola thiotaurini TaxID=1543721 RepID=A0A558D754_9GAMM|nr:1,6-anhydro-N-acetylmuramyl-L-alanine amidase AmpD [Sedimenticola sp.]MCW9022942.1 1,6-anhydro-N-acetylmuramyl-L-alanine amidase AmpD [Sedimenticola sp.]TVT56786.1 MAG: 1,6-anhydro-N-acetylmuramyl-L-alanine amidase AmpD [Sedimenticola thiotaurini]
MTFSETGVLAAARQCPSPNQDERPATCEINLLVIHGISLPPNEFGGPWIDRFFQNKLPPDAHPYFAEINHLKVSSHLLIRRDGELVQYVPLHQRAWHAGQSCFNGVNGCNDFSIGIELEGSDETPYSEEQYKTLAQTIRLIQRHYPAITDERITGHSDIAPDRKTDPGPAFDWPFLRQLLAETR